jgi:hypothetical protein
MLEEKQKYDFHPLRMPRPISQEKSKSSNW